MLGTAGNRVMGDKSDPRSRSCLSFNLANGFLALRTHHPRFSILLALLVVPTVPPYMTYFHMKDNRIQKSIFQGTYVGGGNVIDPR